MNKFLSIILSIFVLGCVVIVTNFWIRGFYESVRTYRSPVVGVDLPALSPANLSAPGQVVLVIVSGLGQLNAETLDMPALSQIRQTGAAATVQSQPPTFTQTSWGTLVTGAPPDSNDAPPVDVSGAGPRPIGVGTIFSRAHAAQLKTALLGDETWRQLIPRNDLDQVFYVNPADPAGDQLVFENALLALDGDAVDLLVVQFSLLAHAARNQGGTGGAAYREAARQIDAYVGQIHQRMDLGRGVLLVVGDHGYTADGGRGGAEPELTQQPLVLAGGLVSPGNYSDVYQTDIAPTITTLLGVEPPGAAQGRILFEMLRLPQADTATAQLLLAEQRIGLAQTIEEIVSGQPSNAAAALESDLEQAQQTLAQNNLSGAFQLAQLAQESADDVLAAAQRQHISGKQLSRLLLSAGLLLLWGGLLWRRRGKYVSVIVIAAALTVALYHILYQLQGFEYSLSAINDFSTWPFSVARRVAVSLLAGGGLILITLMLTGEENWLIALGTGYGFGVLVTFVFALPLFWAFWQNGWQVELYLPAVDVVFWQITATFEAMIAAAIGLFLPWPIMLLIVFVTRTRRLLSGEPQPPPKPDALPGLHL
ncbi:MAG: hypothetical protein D6768_06385 [Chloroflexi bacterium]|nr:MAG: hypothetical protein D6768_06385 [Chloroflexota bacterium]